MKILTLGIFTFLLFTLTSTNAQSVKGVLTDEKDKSPIVGATVKLLNKPDSLNKDTTTAYTTLSNKDGVFFFANVAPKFYLLSISSIGLGTYQLTILVKDSIAGDLGIIAISKTSKILTEVSVVVSAAQVKQKVDTVEYSASQFKVNPDANAEDLIKKMPGVTVDRAGTVTAQGEQVRKVTVDGKDFFGDDATAALRNLPAEIIDKIQVFDRLSDQAAFTGVDDGNSQKAINVVTKANMRNGQFGRLYAGYGTDDRYSAGGNVSFFKDSRRISLVGNLNNINQQNFSSQDLLGVTSSGGGGNRGGGQGGGGNRGGAPQGGRGGSGNYGGGGGQQNFLVGQQNGISKTNAFGINYSDMWGKKLQVSGSYFFNNTINNNNQVTNGQRKLNADSTLYYKENVISGSTNYNHRINLRMEYKIDSSNQITISPSLNFQNNKSNSISSFLQVYSSDYSLAHLLNTSDNKYSTETSGYNFSNQLFYRHSFPKRGRTISVGVNTSFNHKLGDNYSTNNSKFYDNGLAKDSVSDQFIDNLTDGYSVSANLIYTEPIGKGQFQFSYNPSFSKNKADQQTYQFDNSVKKYSIFDTKVSNKFDNTYTTQNGGITYRTGDRDNQFSIGASLQNSNLQSDQIFPKTISVNKTFTNVLPNLQLRRKLSARRSINVFVRTSVNAPSVTQLQNVENTTNSLQYSTGNPDLKQQYTSSVVTRYTFTNTLKGQSFFANVFFQKADNYLANATFFNNKKDSTLPSGVILKRGIVLSKPVNLDGNYNVRSFLTYGAPLKFIKSNINLNAGASYNRLPSSINNVTNIRDNYTYNAGVVVSSNISQYVDFNVSYTTNYNLIVQEPNNKYNTQNLGVQFNMLSKKGWFVQNDLNNQTYNYTDPSATDQNFWLWNLGAGKKFLKNQNGELKLSVFDLLKQNKSISRTVTETIVEDVQSQVLQRYFLLTFTYKLKNFGTAAARAANNRQRDEQRGDRGF